MKKLLAIGLFCLLLTACGKQGTQQLGNELYNPDSAIEMQTQGAVRAYALNATEAKKLLLMGNQLLLIGDDAVAILLSGINAQVVAQTKLQEDIFLASGLYDVADSGFAYYVRNTRQVICLDSQLCKSAVYDLPAQAQGDPAISLHKQEIFYYADSQLRAISMQTGISRLIRAFSDTQVEITGVYFDGAVLSCQVNANEKTQTVYIYTQTGQTLKQDEYPILMDTYDAAYFALRQDGKILQRIYGTKDTQPMSLNIATGNAVPALAMQGVIAYEESEENLALDYYDLLSGKKTAQLTLTGISNPIAWCADAQGIWFVACEQGVQGLYRWDITKSQTEDVKIYTDTLYTYENPDAQGLSLAKSRAEALDSAYGVRIRIFSDAVAQTGKFTMKSEHQVLPIAEFLDAIEPLLAQYPQDFLKKAGQTGKIHIGFVREIDGNQDFVQYWLGGDCYIVMDINADVQTAFLRSLAYAIDSRVLGNSRDFDTWEDLNPEGFVYGSQDSQYIADDNRFFADEASMLSVQEERSRLFCYASMQGNEALFEAPAMQAKLKKLCKGIREAFGLEKSKDTYVWEQYLNESLAYKK